MTLPFNAHAAVAGEISGPAQVQHYEAEPVLRPSNPAERSRFSQWLASFGLGEVPMPLLTRRRAQRS